MNRISLIIQIILFYSACSAQGFGVMPRILAKPKAENATHKKVKDLQTNCSLENGCDYLYPVIQEEFDYPSDLPNKWKFDLGYTQDDDVGLSDNYSTWMGDAATSNTTAYVPLNSNNFQFNNGIMTLSLKQNLVNRNGKDYNFTSGMINSLSRFRSGSFEARIKVPTANKMFPAFWLLYHQGNYAEIDIFEYFDDNISGDQCSTYDLHRMSIHNGSGNSNEYHRSDKYPQDIDSWHDYKLVWDDFQTIFCVDGVLKGYATKCYEGTTPPYFSCVYGASENSFDPIANYNCTAVNALPDNLLPTIPYINFGPRPWWLASWISWPPPQPPQPYLANYIYEQNNFPNKNSAMSLIINNWAHWKYKDDDFSSFSQNSLDMQVDWVKVYQPFCCDQNKTIYTLNDLDYQTKNTGFFTGKILTIGTTSGNGNFQQLIPASPYYRELPSFFLATEEIQINNEAIFEPGVYTEMRITNCNGAFREDNTNSTPNKNIGNSQYKYNDVEGREKIISANINDNYVSIEVYPVPSSNEINIKCDDIIFENITSLTLVDVNGSHYDINKDRVIHLEKFSSGCYQLLITLKDNKLITKRIIKM